MRDDETWCAFRRAGSWPAGEELEWYKFCGRRGVANEGVDGRPPTDAGGGGNANGWDPPRPTEPVLRRTTPARGVGDGLEMPSPVDGDGLQPSLALCVSVGAVDSLAVVVDPEAAALPGLSHPPPVPPHTEEPPPPPTESGGRMKLWDRYTLGLVIVPPPTAGMVSYSLRGGVESISFVWS